MHPIGALRMAAAALFAWVSQAACPAAAADHGPPPPPVAPAPAELGPLFATPTTADAIGRVVAPVYVNGQGPFRFMVDTGANRSVLSPHLARALGIDVSGAPRQLVHGVTGAEDAPVVNAGELRFGRVTRRGLAMPVLSNHIHANADGMLGADQMINARLLIDFKHNRIEISDTAQRATPSTYTVLPAQMRFGQLPLVTARIGRVTVRAVIDTGAERSLGNVALRRALEANRTRLQSEGMTWVSGAVGADALAELVWAPHLELAGVAIERLPILFADTHFFQIWDLEDEPALLIGMDVLGQLDTLVIDYRRQQVGFRMPAAANVGINLHGKATRL